MNEDDQSVVPDEVDDVATPFPLVIAVTPSPAERIRLAERLDGVAPLLLVADFDELRRLIGVSPPPRGEPPAALPPAPPPTPVTTGQDVLHIDSVRCTARCSDREVPLTRLEQDLLVCLTTEPVRVWSYAELHRSVWRDEKRQATSDVQSLVKRLRRKLDRLDSGVTVVAVRGVGFRLTGHHRPRTAGN
ncbi:helix-turn-helix domain-containing protein [Micromonospora sp. DT233]|uniref:helix-turn-helix domain-containing protein n=1 Tax=Micromonospora sp. DT233 TaxID=3393432 RepID=UPI003CF8B57E